MLAGSAAVDQPLRDLGFLSTSELPPNELRLFRSIRDAPEGRREFPRAATVTSGIISITFS
jgi:hypothetical protein